VRTSCSGTTADAVRACERATTFLDASWRNYLTLAAAYGQHGDVDKAVKARAELAQRQPGYTIATDRAAQFSHHAEYLRLQELHFYPGLRKAKLPEQ
jgi:predicted Zn-dependent protease